MCMIDLKPHNQKAVKEITRSLENGNKKIIYVAGTGCGKTWVFMGTIEVLKAMIDKFNKPYRPKVLYIMPKHVIKENIEGYDEYKKLDCTVNFITFNYFNNLEKGMSKIEAYDVVIIDECHHLGADIYGKTIVECMNNSDKYFLGLTATPFRDTDKVDVSDFFEDRVDGISVFDAIHLGLMPIFNYHICLPEKDTRQLEREYENKIKAVVDYMDSAEAVYDIVSKYDRKKWICFFAKKKDIDDAMPMIKEIFEGYNIHILLADLRNLKQVMEEVRNEERSVILSVNILLEGVHLDDITGIVLYRNVTSTIAFQQILGRVCKIGNDIEPVVIDTSRSARKILAKLISESKKSKGGHYIPPVNGGHRDVMKVGIGGTIEFDLNKVLIYCDNAHAKAEKIKEATIKAIDKYRSFNGSEAYESFEDLKNSGLDFQKFKKCAELYHISAELAWENWKVV